MGFIALAVVACSKEQEQELTTEIKTSAPVEQYAIAPNMEANMSAGDDDDLCQSGSANCTGITIVGGIPQLHLDLMVEIDNGTESDFLNDASTADLAVLDQGDADVGNYYSDVANGRRTMSYTRLNGTNAVAFHFAACSSCASQSALDQVIRSN